jgi:hypothetical protein
MSLPVRPFRFMPCAACCHKCQACKDGIYPDELTVTLSGIVNGGGCSDCVNANGAWVLQKAGDCSETWWGIAGPPPPLGGAVWQSLQNYQGSFPSVNMCQGAGGQGTLTIFLQIGWNQNGVAGQRAIVVHIGNNLGYVNVEFRLLQQSQTEPFDCPGLSSLSIPYQGAALYCGSPGATCSVSA